MATTTLADSLVSSSSRPLPIRMRPDLVARKQRYQGRIYWVVKEPVGLQYFRFEEEEYAILKMLDGRASLEQIAEQFEAQFPPQTIRTEELQHFIGTLHRSGLVITNAGGQGEQLKKLRDEKVNKQRISTFSNILAVRFKGIDPERILNFLHGYLWWFWTKPMLVVNSIIVSMAALLILVQFDVFQSKLPTFHEFFRADSWENWLLLGLVIGGTKIFHEFGHGLSCKYFGGECHEMGVMFLVLTPCLYCNVSDSWMLPNRWHRAAIGAAGMYVEVVLASICTFIWWFSDSDTTLNNVCLNIMFVSSVSTILFNANPLLRYDGYYILSDIIEIPNLRQKATTILTRKLGHWCLGIEPQDDPFLPQGNQALFALYSMAAAVYRWVVLFSILYFLNKVFEPYGLKILGQAIAMMSVYGLVVMPLWQLYKYFKVPGRLGKVKGWRLAISAAIVVAFLVGVASIPLPSHVYSHLVVQPSNSESVIVQQTGVLEEISEGIKPGVYVTEGQQLARLTNPELEAMVLELEGQKKLYEERLIALDTASRLGDTNQRNSAKGQIATVKQSLIGLEKQLEDQRENLERLVIRAPRSGVVIPPELVPEPKAVEEQLPTWWGTPFDKRNLGATLETGTKFCVVGNPKQLEARILLEQGDSDFVAVGQKVTVLLDQSPWLHYTSEINDIEKDEIPVVPSRLSSLTGGPLATEMDDAGVPRPLTPHFYAFAPITYDGNVLIGQIGQAKIAIPDRTLWQRLSRYVARTFNFDL
ncbi:hemolysin D [Aeoliella mucimassa]|uniref:Peptide zinc metalloprotease protein YydH n=1 Tax=Aeoliella mucimassa TaxID=2527972 RepID=A0A518AJH9_9BACT|nr:hemolysin D [Aeoliella mucimassa]QDU54860.1 Putative peptide zinc metalloprotease protein YydH [Aeoliella mucimassa]